ncbi:MAG TPA: EAL domain-containing protein [Trebonia sp.]|nr:EAL domain-containing protein [Trebonia sp.]
MGTWLTWRRVLAGYIGWTALLVAVHYAFTGLREEAMSLTGVSAVAAMLTGVARNRPARRAPWLLLAAANLAAALGGIGLHVAAEVSKPAVPFPPFANGVYLVAYPFYIAGLVLFVRSRPVGRDLRGVTDALIFLAGLALLLWVTLLVPGPDSPPLTWIQRSASVAYPVGNLLILLILSRMVAPGPPRGTPAVLLTLGTAGLLASDVAYNLIEYSGKNRYGALLDLGWLACFIAWGAAALHPSMTELTRPAGDQAPDATQGTLVTLMLASLIPPVFLFVRSFTHRNEVEGVVAVVCGVLYLLMLSRLWDVAASHRRGLIRERALRVASAALASAGSVTEVAAAVRDAASALLPGIPAERASVLAVRDGDYLRQVDPAGPRRAAYLPDPVSIWLKLAEGPVPTFVSITEIRAARTGVAPSARAPDDPVSAGYEGAMLCPLTLEDRPVGDPFIGLLQFFGDRRPLSDLAAVLEILAGQVALAVERLALTQEVVRRRGEALFRTLVQDTSDVILIIGDDRRIRYATPSAGDLFGGVTVEGALLEDLVAPSAREDVNRVLDLTLTLSAAGSAIVPPGYLLRVERLDGREAVLEVRWSDLRHDATVGGLVLTVRDVTEQHALEEELKHQAFHDALTGLPNRAFFAKEAASALEAARAVGRTVGVLFVDLDDFKVVNDTMGHGVGDELLGAVAARLTASVRQSDTAARLGGDEFALLIDDAAGPEAVDAFAERIVAAFTEPFTLSEATVLTAATVGVATSRDSDDVDELLRHADLALYAAKSAGKRHWRHYHPVLTSGMLRRREMQAALEDAVTTEAFTLAYQPIVGLANGEIAGFESLLRWPHPRRGMMLPGQFISLAEETGLIVPLGAWALRRALSDMLSWRRDLPPRADGEPDPPYVSVNVSARQFRDPGFTDSVRQALRASGLPPSALLLELTESLLLGGSDRVRADLDELKEIGVKLALDDFGTGYSSLSYLLDLPIDVLKIDKSFVTGIASSWRRHALVEGIVRLARTLKVEVVAEGIETGTERELLAGMGCQLGQGYLLSVPVDSDAAAAMLRLGHGLVTELPHQQRRKTEDGRYLTDL